MKVFVIHYDKLVERKKNMLIQLKNNNIEAEFISNYGKENLIQSDKDKFINLTLSEISIFLHHIECYKKIVENEYDYALILEDDTLFNNNFSLKLKEYMNHLPPDWDVLYIGDGCGKHISPNILKKCKNCRICRKNEDKCAVSYLISKKTANLIYTIFKTKVNNNNKIDLAVDMWVNRLYQKMPFLKIFWAEPTIVTQGSEKKIFKSTIYHTMGINDNFTNI